MIMWLLITFHQLEIFHGIVRNLSFRSMPLTTRVRAVGSCETLWRAAAPNGAAAPPLNTSINVSNPIFPFDLLQALRRCFYIFK